MEDQEIVDPIEDKGDIIPELQWIENITNVMDNLIKLPVLGTIGIDPLVGMIPVVGEVTTYSVSGLMVIAMARHGVSGKVILKMLWNISLDALVGMIPFLGDLMDFRIKANRKNLILLKEHQIEGKHKGHIWWIILAILIALFGIFALVLYVSSLIYTWVLSWFGY